MRAINVLNNGLRQTIIYCYGVGTEFEAAMSQVEAISGASGESLEALTNKAKELGSITKFTATEVANAMNYMAMAGWDAKQMLAGIDGVIRLAASSGEDLRIVADIVTDALTAFGMKAEDVGHFADVLAAASANANTNVSMLGESFKYVAPLAGTMGYSIDETAEALGIMANSGIKASTAGTSMRTMLTNLSQGVTISAAAFGEMKISAANADGTMKSLNEVLGELREAFALMTDEEKTNNAATIAGDRALSGFLALVNAGEADINKLRSAIESCDGAAANMAETMQQNVAGKATILKSALEGLGIAIYEKFSGRLGESIDNITDKLDNMHEKVEDGALGDSLDGLADSVGNAAEELSDIAQEYDELTKSAGETAEKREKLNELQQTFIKNYGSEVEGIDLVNGAYEEQAGILQDVIDKHNALAKSEAISAYNKMMEAEKREYETTYSIDLPFADQRARDVLKKIAGQNLNMYADDRNLTIGGDTEEKHRLFSEIVKAFEETGLATAGGGVHQFYDEIVEKRREYQDTADANREKLEKYYYYTSGGNVYPGKVAGEYGDGTNDGQPPEAEGAENKPAKDDGEKTAEEYKTQKQLADDLYKVKEISAAEYSDRLTALRDEYLTEGTHEWYEATKEIMSLTEKAASGIGDAADDTADRIKAAFSVVKNEFQKLLNDIDNELEQHSRDKEDEEYQGKVDSLTNRLKYERLDVYTRRSLEKELADVNENWDEVIYQRNMEDKKDIIRDASASVDAVLKASDVSAAVQAKWNSIISGMAAAQQISPGTSGAVGGVANAAVYNITINGLNKTGDQIENELLKKISSKVV